MRGVRAAWESHGAELRRFLRQRVTGADEAEDLLQEVFLRAMRQPEGLGRVDNPRAWLFHAARNLLIDRQRLARVLVPLPEDLAAEPESSPAPVDALSQCLPKVLPQLLPEDREAITFCDLEGMTQQAYAERIGLSLPAVKSRVRRARARLKAHLTEACQVRLDEAGRVCCFAPRVRT